uniref:Predicted nucleic acid-binding protein, contains PIN domain n=1 Tax=Candidatus Kentrum sp. DK TaxID=2126562 RepID=A0A450SYJ2_9GAMM|nr:MAG: Predicted nucleic acid-binding protein, contains PIN domain [Candidatus Kentron sp. DK]
MNYLLDSNTLSDFYDRESGGHEAIFCQLSVLPDDARVLMSVLSLYEFEYGYANVDDALRPSIRAKITEAGEDFEVLPLSREGDGVFGEIKQSLRKRRGISGENIKKHNIDVMFAAEALAHRCIPVSADRVFRDIREFRPELMLENWL